MDGANAGWSPHAFSTSCFDGWRPLLREFERHQDWPTLTELEARWLGQSALVTPDGERLRLVVDQKSRRRKNTGLDELYDFRIMRGELPTRARSWHDFFNVGAFCLFPRTKMLVHARNAEAISEERSREASPLERRRSRARDTLALLDEGGILLAVERGVAEPARCALAGGDMGELRALASAGRLVPWVLGHALLEHAARSACGERLGQPPRGLTWVVAVTAPGDHAEVDACFCEELLEQDVLQEPPSWLGHTLDQWFLDVPGRPGQ